MRFVGYRLAVMAAVVVLAGACSDSGGSQKQEAAAAPAVVAAAKPVPAAADAGPPMEDGIYTFHSSCPGEGSCYRHWRAEAKIELRAGADGASPLVATLAHGDWVELIDGFVRMVPRRGVVIRDDEALKKGDVVFIVGGEGEGVLYLWRRGKEVVWQDVGGPTVIEWDDLPEDPARAAKLGWWVKLKTAKGVTGWVQEPSGFECMGQLQGSTNCRDDEGKPLK